MKTTCRELRLVKDGKVVHRVPAAEFPPTYQSAVAVVVDGHHRFVSMRAMAIPVDAFNMGNVAVETYERVGVEVDRTGTWCRYEFVRRDD